MPSSVSCSLSLPFIDTVKGCSTTGPLQKREWGATRSSTFADLPPSMFTTGAATSATTSALGRRGDLDGDRHVAEIVDGDLVAPGGRRLRLLRLEARRPRLGRVDLDGGGGTRGLVVVDDFDHATVVSGHEAGVGVDDDRDLEVLVRVEVDRLGLEHGLCRQAAAGTECDDTLGAGVVLEMQRKRRSLARRRGNAVRLERGGHRHGGEP